MLQLEKIKSLFDPSKNIYRTIEKVITYNVSREEQLKAEIFEYVVTEKIEENLEKLLTKMQMAMDVGGQNEVGVWVSGFYGSGKSSLTKYLGMAFDDRVKIDGIPFIQHFQNRLHKPQTKALLSTVAKRFPAAVILLDLASEMLAGATMEEVSTVLYYKVLQWAGYSRNIKVAAFERKLKKDGRYEEFRNHIQDIVGVKWNEVQNDLLVVDTVIPEIAHQMYPSLFKTPSSFSSKTDDIIRFENERVKEMLDIVREVSGKQYIIFIIDEVGQYVGSRQNLILNLDGLAKNLKNIGDGKVWIIGTAQQTLTEDNPRAALNSPDLYKLKDRFPIQVDLESSDIREICYKRLLVKGAEGEKILGALFDKFGQELRYNTKLQDAKYYDSEFNRETFINLYPFLPAHFDILLHLLGALAKSTGGIGLRSAIKVVQDILIEGANGRDPFAEKEVGWLVNTVTLYDSLEKDIRRAHPSIYRGVEKALIRFPDIGPEQEVAKTVAVLQILGNIPVTVHNVVCLIHPSISISSRLEEVEHAVANLIKDSKVPFGEQDGNLCFFSEKLNDIEQERIKIPLRSIELKRIFNESLKEVFKPAPSVRINGTLVVTSGLKSVRGSSTDTLDGEREEIQTYIQLVEAADYENIRNQLIIDSRHQSAQKTIYLLGRNTPEIEEKVAEIYRCSEVSKSYRNDPDPEVRKYCSSQLQMAENLSAELGHIFKRCLSAGSLIFRGQVTAVETLGQNLLEACKKYLDEVAAIVFDRHQEAPVRVETSIAEKFLKHGNLAGITSQIDPLGLVQIKGGKPFIFTEHKALLSIRDYIDRNGTIEGKVLAEKFGSAPFGWSPDTLRYLVAALLLAGEIKLKVSGREVTVNGQQAIEALKTNNTFKNVGVSLRDERPSVEVLARAAERLQELVGDTVIPLEDTISRTAVKYLPKFQSAYAPLGEKLKTLNLPGCERINAISRDITDILFIDASDAPQRFGSETSLLYENLKWANEIEIAFNHGLDETIRGIRQHIEEIKSFPEGGILGQLRQDLTEEFVFLEERLNREDFYKYIPDLNTRLTSIKAKTRDAASRMSEEQADIIKAAADEINRFPEWLEYTQEEQFIILDQLQKLQISISDDLSGLKKIILNQFSIHSKVGEIKEHIHNEGKRRKLLRLEEEKKKAMKEGKTAYVRDIKIPSSLTKMEQLDELINTLQALKNEFAIYNEINLKINIGE